MAKFPKMDKSGKEYERVLRQFKWTEAEAAIGVDFDSTGLARAKAALTEALDAGLKKPYGKIGLVRKNLVFRIKYDNKHHYGDDDIILIRNFSDIAGEESLSGKSKNQGVLERASARDPLTMDWWEQTLGSEATDPSNLSLLIPKFRAKYDTLKGVAIARGYVETLEALAEIKGELRKVIAAFPAKNDRILLKKLVDGVAFYENAVRTKQDELQSRIGTALRDATEYLNANSKQKAADALRPVKQGASKLASGDQRGAAALRDEAEAALKTLAQMTSEAFIQRVLAQEAQKNKVHSDDVPVRLIGGAMSDAQRRVAAVTAELQTFAQAVGDTASAPSEGKRGFKKVNQITDTLKKLMALAKDVETAADHAEDMYIECTTSVRLGNTDEQWLDIATTGLNDRLVPAIKTVSDTIAKARADADNNTDLLDALDKLDTATGRLQASCNSGSLFQKVKAARKAQEDAPGKVSEGLQKLIGEVDKLKADVEKAEASVDGLDSEGVDRDEAAKLVVRVQTRMEVMAGDTGFKIMKDYYAWPYLEQITKKPLYASLRSDFSACKALFDDLRGRIADLGQRVS